MVDIFAQIEVEEMPTILGMVDVQSLMDEINGEI